MADYLPPAAPTTPPEEGATGLPIKWPELPDSVNPIVVRALRTLGRRGFKSLLRVSAIFAVISAAAGGALRLSSSGMMWMFAFQLFSAPQTFFGKLADKGDGKGWASDFLRISRMDPESKVVGKFLTMSMSSVVFAVAILLGLLTFLYFPWGGVHRVPNSAAVGWALILWTTIAHWQGVWVRAWAGEHAWRSPRKGGTAHFFFGVVGGIILILVLIGLLTSWTVLGTLVLAFVETAVRGASEVDWTTALRVMAVAAVGVPINLTLALATLQPENCDPVYRRVACLVALQALVLAVMFGFWVGLAGLFYGLDSIVDSRRMARKSLICVEEDEETAPTSIASEVTPGTGRRGALGLFPAHGALQFPDGWNPILLRQVRDLTRPAVPTFFVSTGLLSLAIALLFYPWLAPLPDVLAAAACIIPSARTARNLKSALADQFELLRPTRLTSRQIIMGMWMSASVGLPTSLAAAILYLFIRNQIMPRPSWQDDILASQGYVWGSVYFFYSTVGQVQAIYAWARAVHRYQPDWPKLRLLTTRMLSIASGGLILWYGGSLLLNVVMGRMLGRSAGSGGLVILVALVFLHMAFMVNLSVAALEAPRTRTAIRSLIFASVIVLVEAGLVVWKSPLAALGILVFQAVMILRRYCASADKSGAAPVVPKAG